MEAVEAGTIAVGSHASTNVGLNMISEGRALRVLVRTASAGVFLGGSSVSATNGYELTAGQEYDLVIRPTVGHSGADENGLNVYNNSGSTVTVSWLITAAE